MENSWTLTKKFGITIKQIGITIFEQKKLPRIDLKLGKTEQLKDFKIFFHSKYHRGFDVEVKTWRRSGLIKKSICVANMFFNPLTSTACKLDIGKSSHEIRLPKMSSSDPDIILTYEMENHEDAGSQFLLFREPYFTCSERNLPWQFMYIIRKLPSWKFFDNINIGASKQFYLAKHS